METSTRENSFLRIYDFSFRRILHSSLTHTLTLVILFLLSALPHVISFPTFDFHPSSSNQALNCNKKRAQTEDGWIATPELEPVPLQ